MLTYNRQCPLPASKSTRLTLLTSQYSPGIQTGQSETERNWFSLSFQGVVRNIVPELEARLPRNFALASIALATAKEGLEHLLGGDKRDG
jgi:hypothetical protein